MNDSIIEILTKESSTAGIITKSDILKAFKTMGVKLSDVALRQRIFILSEKGLLQSVKRGIYSINVKPYYSPFISDEIKKISRLFASEYPEINYCIWSQSWLHDFMNHQPFDHSIIFETEKDMIETSFILFRDNKLNALNNPDKNIIQDYTRGIRHSIIVKKLIYNSPIVKTNKVHLPAFEKILVDVFCDSNIHFVYQGSELSNIYRNALKNYNVNLSLLLRYASIRNQKSEIKEFLSEQILIPKALLS